MMSKAHINQKSLDIEVALCSQVRAKYLQTVKTSLPGLDIMCSGIKTH